MDKTLICIIIICAAAVLTACSTQDAGRPTPDKSASEGVTEDIISGGVPKDGIPSVDDPKFTSVSETDLNPDDIVFGVAQNDTAKAYPRHILVHHEIVNDEINGDNISVTYCPLTGTAMGFRRGNTTFGVSGKLVNSNLIMYDRATNSYFPQIKGAGITGDRRGERLDQFRVI